MSSFMICYLLLSIFKLEVDILIHSLEEVERSDRLKSDFGDSGDIFWNNIVDQLRPHMQRLDELFM